MQILRNRNSKWLGLCLGALSVPLFLWGLFQIANQLYQQQLKVTPYEVLTSFFLLFCCLMISKSRIRGLLLYFLLYTTFLGITITKSLYLEEYLVVEDFRYLFELIVVTSIPKILLSFIFVAFFLRALWAFLSRKKMDYFRLGILLLLVHFGVKTQMMETVYRIADQGQSELWSVKMSSWKQGPLFYLYLHHLMFERPEAPVTKEDVQRALKELQIHPSKELAAEDSPISRPNVYIVVVESLWDFQEITRKYQVPDAFDPEFRQIYEQNGSKSALVSEVVGGTANAEFEILCGFPVLNLAKLFKYKLNNQVECLPRVLKKKGYQSLVFHPGYKQMWNRDYTYPRMGFDHYFFGSDLTESESRPQDYFLNDELFLKNSFERIESEIKDGKPHLFHLLTIGLHSNFSADAQTRIRDFDRIENENLKNYLQLQRRSTRALAKFLENVRRIDPQGIVLIFGDHAPPLDKNFQSFKDGNRLQLEEGILSSVDRLELLKTPLVIWNLEVESEKLIRLPYLTHKLYKSLKVDGGISNIYRSPNQEIFSYNLILDPALQKYRTCDSSTDCSQFFERKKAFEILMRDHFFGPQFSSEFLGSNGD